MRTHTRQANRTHTVTTQRTTQAVSTLHTQWGKVRTILQSFSSRCVVTAGLLASFALSTPAQAQVNCGDTVGPNETVTLIGEISICDDFHGNIVVQGPATLDLGGFDIRCADLDNDGVLPQGVVLLGEKARVRNGSITGCGIGVTVGGGGKQRDRLAQAQTLTACP